MGVLSGLTSDGSEEYDEYESVSTTPTADYEDLMDLMCDKSSVRAFRGRFEPLLYGLIFLLGSLGNLAVVWIYVHFRQRLKTMTDVYLLNLAVADLLFLGTLPLWASDAVQGWLFGAALCKVTWAVYKVNLFSSMWLLTCISIDRYVVIVQTTVAQNSKRQRLSCSKLVCAVVWLLAAALAVPELFFATTKTRDGALYCDMVYNEDNKDNRIKILVLVLQICMGFCLPILVMLFCYTTIIHTLLKTKNFQKHKALRVILVVVAVFIFSQLPYNSVLVVEATQAHNITQSCEEAKRFDMVGEVLKGLAYTHACLNPFLYAFVGVRFRRDVVMLLQSYGCWPGPGKLSKQGGPLRSSVMSDTDGTALSL